MSQEKEETKEVMSILKDALGVDEVNEEKFTFNGEEIKYWQGDYYPLTNPERYMIGNRGGKLNEIEPFINSVKHGDKSFLFYRIKDYDKYLFSFEIVDYELGNQMDIVNGSDLEKLSGFDNEIVRIKRKDKGFMVAIKIGDQENRDYSALKHYIVSSDNRTYNKVVRNMIEYISVNPEQSIPENKTELPHNLLVSGAPGTGKSHYLDVQTKKAGGVSTDQDGKISVESNSVIGKLIEEYNTAVSPDEKRLTATKEYCDKYVTRVTFYEDYSYENFIGCYKPVPEESSAQIEYDGKKGALTENKITYGFVSGPFIDTYVNAKKDPDHSYYLIIEEINRAKAASVFGDMFQLLDREDGISEYEIRPDTALNDYLKEKLQDEYSGMMKLPQNMYLWATMNSADQGVMPLDSAFKRRWAQMYMDINPQDGSARGDELFMPSQQGMQHILWENLRESINSVILNSGFDEDRCIGSWYFSKEEIDQINEYFEEKSTDERINMVNPLIDKLLYYLRQDLFRRNPGLMFKQEEGEKPGISMSDLRRRVRQNESIDTILNVEELKWCDE